MLQEPILASLENSTNSFSDFEYVAVREQEVKAHVGTVHYQGLGDILLAQDLSDGCGGKIWESANVMINYLVWKNAQLNGQLFQNQKVIEVGAGTGLVGLAVAKACPNVNQVIITDQIAMMNLMKQNIELNNLSHVAKAELLNWGEDIASDSDLLNANVILASDCIYLEITFIPLIETLFALSQKQDTVIYLCNRKRRKADKRFFQLARKKFVFQEVLDDPYREDYKKESIQLFIVKRK